MTWGEAISLTNTLAQDPTSWIVTAIGGWDHPRSWEWFVLADLYDLQRMIAWSSAGRKGAKPKPYPRPGPSQERRVAKSGLSQEETLAALRYAGHTNLPTAA